MESRAFIFNPLATTCSCFGLPYMLVHARHSRVKW